MIKKNYSWFILFFSMVMTCTSGAMESKSVKSEEKQLSSDQERIFKSMENGKQLDDLEREQFMQLFDSSRKKETPEEQMRRISLRELRYLAKRLFDAKNLHGSTGVLDTVACILNGSARQEVFFTDNEINPCFFDLYKGVLFQLCAADVGHVEVVKALSKHNITKSEFTDSKGAFGMQQIVDVASLRAKKSVDLEQKKRYLETMFALVALRKKQSERLLE